MYIEGDVMGAHVGQLPHTCSDWVVGSLQIWPLCGLQGHPVCALCDA